MRFKLITVFLFIVGMAFNGCVEEPTMTPYNRPYSVVRIANLTANVDQIAVTIDGKALPVSGTIGNGAITDWFDYSSGTYTFEVSIPGGNVIYSKKIDITSFETISVLFTGYYSANTDENTFGNMVLSEGEIYVNFAPPANTFDLFLVQASTISPNSDARRITSVTAHYTPEGGTPRDTAFVTIDNPLTYGNEMGFGSLPKGEYSFTFQSGTDTVATDAGTYDGNMRYYMFIYGPPENMKLFKNVIPPPPVRQRN